jgi:hypothetical protein
MLLHPNIQLSISDVDSLFPRQPYDSLQVKAEEALHSHVVVGFEEALALGMPPLEALGHVLCWVASEMARIKPAQVAQEGARAPSPKAG